MDRRHQIFVSSTYDDLKRERAEVIQALLELDCFPAGMELFPATSTTAWDLIKGVINDSDYYCLVIAGRYGSINDGLGYTEKEYDYAVSIGKPVMVFLHKQPESIPAKHTEKTDVGRTKLEVFRAKVAAIHHCKYWSSAEELGGQVSRSLILMRRTNPSEGWIPGKFAADESLLLENATLHARVSQLEADLVISTTKGKLIPTQNIACGEDIYTPTISFKLDEDGDYIEGKIPLSWNKILVYVGPSLLGECTEDDFLTKLKLCFFHSISDHDKWKSAVHDSVIIPFVIRDKIKIQLRALGHMAPGTKRRAVSDQKMYWRLTEEGESHLIQVQAVKRPSTAVSTVTESKSAAVEKPT